MGGGYIIKGVVVSCSQHGGNSAHILLLPLSSSPSPSSYDPRMFVSSRLQMVAEVHKAPLRRVDNVITRLNDATRLLRMHAVVLNAVKQVGRPVLGVAKQQSGGVGS